MMGDTEKNSLAYELLVLLAVGNRFLCSHELVEEVVPCKPGCQSAPPTRRDREVWCLEDSVADVRLARGKTQEVLELLLGLTGPLPHDNLTDHLLKAS